MKRLTTFLFALLLAGIGAWAQSVIHECVADFSDWSISGNSSGSFQQNTWSTEADASGMTTPFIEYWVGSGSVLPDATISHTALTELTTGYYEVSIFARAFNENSTTAVSKGITFTANDESVDLTEGTAGEFNSVSEEDYGVYELLVYVSDGTLNIGFTVSGLTACDWMAFKNLEVTYLGETSVGYVAHECEAYGDDWGKPAHWTADNDATTNLHVNKHSTEADPSGMVTPFVEYWYASGTNLPDDVLKHDQLTGLYPGNYTVSVEVRAFNESGTTAINEGVTTFNANDASVDITTLTSTTAYNGHYELYGPLYLIAEVGEEGTLDINFTVKNANYNWLSFKNLKVVYDGEALPGLDYVEGIMNADVEAAMKAAVDAYNTSKSADDYTAALAAIAAAEASVAYYAPIAAVVEALDEAGRAVWNATANGQAYTSRSLTSEDVSADLAAAQIAQTTAGSDMSYALTTGKWSAGQGNGPSDYNGYATETYMEALYGDYDPEASEGKVLYYTVTGLQSGTYSVSFYATANMANGVTGNSGSGISVAYANNATTSMTVGTNSAAQITSLDDMTLYAIECKVLTGTLEFGIQNVADGGNWFLGAVNSLTLVSLEAEVEEGDEVHSCEAESSHWTQTFIGSGTNGEYALNTWSDEADASGMVTPFLQTWVESGEVLSDQTIDHNQLSGLPQGWYSVTVDARIMSETGEDITGTATLTANSDYIYLISDGSDGSYNGETEEYGTYTVQCYVGEDGTLDIGFTIKDASFNWFAWKNLSVVYLGATVEYNVGEATASTTFVMPGQTVTLMFADCTKGDEDATLGVSSSANVTFGSTSVTLTPKGTITFTFDVPNDVKIGEYTLTLPASTIVWTLNGETKAGNAAQTITFIVPATIDDGEYLIVDADGNYLGGGLTWGTQAAIIGKPQFIDFEQQANGTYHLDSHQYNYAYAHYLGTNLYFDSYVADWALMEVEGGYAIYGTADTGTGYLTSNGFQKAATVESTPYAWTLVTMDDIVESMADATGDVPVDVTALIKAPELKRGSNREWYPTWTVTGYDGTGTPTDYSFGLNESTSVANCAESFHSENGFNFSQEITLPKAGYYTLSAKGFYRNDGSETPLLPVLYAGDQTSTFPELDTSANNMAEAYAEFLDGLHQIDAILFEAENDDETITIGFKGEDTSLWNIFGELELLYYGTEDPVLPDGTVHECEAPILDSAAEDYDSSDIWTISGNSNGLFQRNTWSTEADPSGLVTPFIEYWVGSGSQLSDATISHTQLTDLTAGYYEVSIFARAFNENNLVDVSEGITFNANNESIDLNKETHATYNHVSAEEYGTYKVYCEVGTEGTLDINFILEDANCDWLAFKNLKVVHLGFSLSALPKLSAAEGTMNSSIESAQSEALEAYASEATLDNYNTAYQAVECARVSIAFYAGIADALARLDAYLDDSGKAWLEENEAIKSYRNNTLTYQDMYDVYWGAVKQQTTAGTVLTDAMEATGEWTAEQGNGPSDYNGYATETYMEALYDTYDSEASVGKVLTYTVAGLHAGTYEVSFYVAANMANEVEGSSGNGITEAFANDATEGITVGTNSGAQITSLDDMTLVTLICTVGEDGILTFGLQNVADGGNWFLCAPVRLTLVSLSIEWEMTSVGWGTLILPFAAEIPTTTDEGKAATLTVYSCAGLESDGTTLTLVEAETIEACTPYILSGTAGTYTFSGVATNTKDSYTVGLLTGTLVDMSQAEGDFTVDSGQYVLQNHADGGLAFYQITSESTGVTLSAYHCYLTYTDTGAEQTALRIPGKATGIVAVEGDGIANGAIYDLAGRKVSKAVKGIYIQNGKKVLVK